MDPLVLPLVIVLVVLGFCLYYFLGSFAYGAGFEPTPRGTVRSMLELAEVGPSDVLVDLGAGTGAVVFRAARERGARAVAIEREPLRFLILCVRRRFSAQRARILVLRQDLFEADLTDATVVALFLWPSTMARLRLHLEARLAVGARVVSHCHPIPGWAPDREDRVRGVFLYRVPPGRGPTAGGR